MQTQTPGNISKRHWSLKEKAREMRRQGSSYNEIRVKFNIAKSTLSDWVRDIPLSDDQKKRLYARKDGGMTGIRIAQEMFWNKRMTAFNSGLELYSIHYRDPDFISGIMLYWAEGDKANCFGFSNSDAEMIRFMAKWVSKYLGYSPLHMTAFMHLHSGQSELDMIQFWSGITGIPPVNFRKTFIKPEGSGYRKNILYHGTIKIRAKGKGSTYALFKVLGALAGFLKDKNCLEVNPEQWMSKSKFIDPNYLGR
ncbi:MAG TPA: hypothetical protein VEA59_01645 [Patescibacteria group bacterium]|nr:hypothetical protein [Patescibacteria group bacterium]